MDLVTVSCLFSQCIFLRRYLGASRYLSLNLYLLCRRQRCWVDLRTFLMWCTKALSPSRSYVFILVARECWLVLFQCLALQSGIEVVGFQPHDYQIKEGHWRLNLHHISDSNKEIECILVQKKIE